MLKSRLLIGVTIITLGQSVFAGNSIEDHEPGFYFGAQGGLAWTNEGSGPEDSMNKIYDLRKEPKSRNPSKGKYGGRLFLGYSFSPYFSLDSGFTLYPSNEFRAEGKNIFNVKDSYKFKTDLYSVDLMAKVTFPLEHLSNTLAGCNLYAKLGAAITRAKYTIDTSFITGNLSIKEESSQIVFSIRPSYALGVGYNFNDHFGVDLSWMGIYSGDKVEMTKSSSGYDIVPGNKTPSANLVALGVTYKF